jgi:hypothetical protein
MSSRHRASTGGAVALALLVALLLATVVAPKVGSAQTTPRGGGASRRDSIEGRTTDSPRRRGGVRVLVSTATNQESNVRFLAPTTLADGRPLADRYQLVSVGATASLSGGRRQLQLDARGDLARFAVLRELDRETWDLGGQLTWRWSARVSSLFGVRAVAATGVLGVGTAEPGLLPLALTRTESAVHSLLIRHTPRTLTTATFDGSRVRFDQATLAGGSTVGAQVQTRTNSGERRSRSWQLDVRYVDFAAQPIATVTSELEWQRPLGRSTWSLRTGATSVGRRPRQAGASWFDSLQVEPTGSLSMARPLGRDLLTLRAGRDVRAGFGFGRALLTESASLAFTHRRPRGAGVTLAVDVSQNVDPFDARLTLRFYGASAEWQRTIGPAAVAATGFARRRVEARNVDNLGAGLQLGFAAGRTP